MERRPRINTALLWYIPTTPGILQRCRLQFERRPVENCCHVRLPLAHVHHFFPLFTLSNAHSCTSEIGLQSRKDARAHQLWVYCDINPGGTPCAPEYIHCDPSNHVFFCVPCCTTGLKTEYPQLQFVKALLPPLFQQFRCLILHTPQNGPFNLGAPS